MQRTDQRYAGGSFIRTSSINKSIFTPEDLSEEQLMIQQTAKKFLEKEVKPNNEAIEKQDFQLVKSLLTKAGELGLLAHSVPEKYGGLGLDKISKGVVGEALGAGGGYSVAHSNHTCIATLPITYFGTDWQKEYYLPKLASGEFIGAYCLTEPSAGSDALSAKTTATLNEAGTHYLLNGSKMFITNANFSDTFIVYAKVDGEAFTAFIVEKDFPGIRLGPEEKKMGIKSSSTTAVFLENCEVPVRNLLGEIGKGHHIALNVLNLGRFNLGAACMGGAKEALKLAISYTNERKQFKQSLANFAATKEKIANMATRIYAAESLQYRTAAYLEEALVGLDTSENHELIKKRMMEYASECAICKVYGSETLDGVVDEALQLHGGYGFIQEYPIEQMYRDSRINRIFEGTNEINRLLIPMAFFKEVVRNEGELERLFTDALKIIEKTDMPTTGELTREQEAVATIRSLLLISASIVLEKFGDQVVHEQEALLKIADLAIGLYAAESVLLRTVKSIEETDVEQSLLKIQLAEVFIGEQLLAAEMLAKKLFAEEADREKRNHLYNILQQKMMTFLADGVTNKKREIAAAIYDAEQYSV